MTNKPKVSVSIHAAEHLSAFLHDVSDGANIRRGIVFEVDLRAMRSYHGSEFAARRNCDYHGPSGSEVGAVASSAGIGVVNGDLLTEGICTAVDDVHVNSNIEYGTENETPNVLISRPAKAVGWNAGLAFMPRKSNEIFQAF